MTLTEKTKFLHKVALRREDKVLILKRAANSKSRPSAWDLPGGNAEWPTTEEPQIDLHQPEIAREIDEETGWQLDPRLFTNEALIFFLTHFDPGAQLYSIACGWLVEMPANIDPATLQLSDEHTDAAWVERNELENYDFGEPVGTYIKDIIRQALKE